MSLPFGDFLAQFRDAASGVVGYLGGPAARGAIVRMGLEQGLSGAEIGRTLQANGIGMRSQNLYGLIGEMRATELAHDYTAAIAQGATLDPSWVTPLGGGREGQYMVNVRSTWQSRDELGNWERGERVTSILQSGAADLAQALADAAALQQQIPEGEDYGGQMIGMEISGVYQWQG